MGPSEWMKVEDFHSTLKVNMNGVIGMTVTFMPLIKKARGRIVNVASVLGRVAANGGGYCISKFAVECFSDCLRYKHIRISLKHCNTLSQTNSCTRHSPYCPMKEPAVFYCSAIRRTNSFTGKAIKSLLSSKLLRFTEGFASEHLKQTLSDLGMKLVFSHDCVFINKFIPPVQMKGYNLALFCNEQL